MIISTFLISLILTNFIEYLNKNSNNNNDNDNVHNSNNNNKGPFIYDVSISWAVLAPPLPPRQQMSDFMGPQSTLITSIICLFELGHANGFNGDIARCHQLSTWASSMPSMTMLS